MNLSFTQVIEEVTTGVLIRAPATVTEVPGANRSTEKPESSVSNVSDDDEETLQEMQNRLQALRS